MWNVVINHQGESAVLACSTLEEARLVRQSYINWGGMGYDIDIVAEKQRLTTSTELL